MTRNLFGLLIAATLLLVGCADGSNDADGQNSNCTGSECVGPNTNGDDALTVEVAYGLVADKVSLAGFTCENTDRCVFEGLADGTFTLTGTKNGHILVDTTIVIENGVVTASHPSPEGELIEEVCDLNVDSNCTYTAWTGEGMCAVAFDKACTTTGTGVHLYTEIYENGDFGDGLIHLWGPPNDSDLLVTNLELSGDAGGDPLEGFISGNGSYVLFQQFTPDGDLWKEMEFDCQ